MSVLAQIDDYLSSLPTPKQDEMRQLHARVLDLMPGCRLWFLDGKDESGRTVSNPSIGYGEQAMPLAGGKQRAFYQVGISANTTGISIYLMGLKDRKALAERFGQRIGQASVTGYCIRLRSLAKVDLAVLADAIRYGVDQTSA